MRYYVTYNPDTEQFDLRDKELCKTVFSSSSRGRCTARLEDIINLTYKPDLERTYYLVDRMGEALQSIKSHYDNDKKIGEYDMTRAMHLHAEIQIALGIPVKY